MFARVLLGCLVLSVVAFVSLAEDPKKPAETKLKPTVITSGSHSQIRRERFEVASTKEAWDKLWEKHRGKLEDRKFSQQSQKLEIDFETHYVVAVFTGWCDWIDVTPRQRGDSVVIGYKAWIAQIAGGYYSTLTKDEKARKEAQAPYAFVVLPKPVKTVVIEEDVRGLINGPPEWKERKRFTAPKDKK